MNPRPESLSTPDAVFTHLLKGLEAAGRTPRRAPAPPATPEALAAALFEVAADTGAALFSVWASEEDAPSETSGEEDTVPTAGISFFFPTEDAPDRAGGEQVPVRQPLAWSLYRPLGQALQAHARRGADPKQPTRGSVSFPAGSADPDLEFRVSFHDSALGTSTTALARDREARQAFPSLTRLPLPADAGTFLEARYRELDPALFQGQLVLLTGERRTGRSTTLRALMEALPDTVHALAAVEEPRQGAGVSIRMARVGQALSVTQAVRSFLRQDPDFLFVDEVRTLEELKLLCTGALTGHATACVLEAKTPEDGFAWLTEAMPDMPTRALIVHHTRAPGTGAFTMSLHETKPTADGGALHVAPWTPPV
jgi:hypothetical protein